MHSSSSLMWTRRLAVLMLVTLLSGAAWLLAANPKGGEIVPPGDNYDQLSADWWQWAFGLPYPDGHPLADGKGKDAANGQVGDIWFLAGVWWPNDGTPQPTPVVRHVQVPQGTSLFFPIVNGENNPVEWNYPRDGDWDAELAAQWIAEWLDSLTEENLYCRIDGVPVQNLKSYRATKSDFSLYLPPGNVLDVGWGIDFDSGVIEDVVADGYFLLVKPMSLGRHTIEFGVQGLDWQMDIVYKLNVVPKAAKK